MPNGDTWPDRFEDYIRTILGVFGFEEVEVQSPTGGGSADIAFRFPQEWELLFYPELTSEFKPNDLVLVECKTGRSGEDFVRRIVHRTVNLQGQGRNERQLLSAINTLVRDSPEAGLIIVAIDRLNKERLLGDDNSLVVDIVELLREEDRNEMRIEDGKYTILILDPGRISMGLFKKDLYYMSRYLLGLKPKPEVCLKRIDCGSLAGHIVNQDDLTEEEDKKITVSVCTHTVQHTRATNFVEVLANITFDTDERINSEYLKEVCEHAFLHILALLGRQFFLYNGVTIMLNIGLHLLVPHFQSYIDLRDTSFRILKEVSDDLGEELLQAVQELDPDLNFKIRLDERGTRVYDYESFAPGGSLLLTLHPLLFHSERRQLRMFPKDRSELDKILENAG